MNQNSNPTPAADKILLSGIHLDLTDALKAYTEEKVGKLLRHEPRIDRVRIDIEYDQTKGPEDSHVAKGRIEIAGPDIVASAHSENAYKSLDELVALLDRGLRKRHAAAKGKRNHPHGVELDAELPKVS